MSLPLIVIPDDAPEVMGASAAFKTLAGRAEVRHFESLPSPDELVERAGDTELIINIRSSVDFDAAMLDRLPRLKMLSLWGTGTDHVDLEGAVARGVTVTNTPGVSAVAMAEHTLALMLSTARKIPHIHAEMRKGGWPRGFVIQLHGKTLGVIGLGAIGRQTVRIARGIGMRVVAWTMHPNPELARELGVELVELDDLYRQSDVVSLHLRQSKETLKMIGSREFGLMKPSALFINTARGPIVDEPALIEALENGQIAAAGLDVFETEPMPPDHRLRKLSNVVMTPHSGGITREALEAGLLLAIENVFSFLAGSPKNVVAAPH